MHAVIASSEFCIPIEISTPPAAPTAINYPAHNTSHTGTIAGPTTEMGIETENELVVSGADG